jgi:hypothetical protein
MAGLEPATMAENPEKTRVRIMRASRGRLIYEQPGNALHARMNSLNRPRTPRMTARRRVRLRIDRQAASIRV